MDITHELRTLAAINSGLRFAAWEAKVKGTSVSVAKGLRYAQEFLEDQKYAAMCIAYARWMREVHSINSIRVYGVNGS